MAPVELKTPREDLISPMSSFETREEGNELSVGRMRMTCSWAAVGHPTYLGG
jgi:hypothetical protein